MNHDQPTPPRPPAQDRRAFFRKLALWGLNRVEQSTEIITKAENRLRALTPVPGTVPLDRNKPAISPYPLRFLRPPGALPEQDFAGTCSRCGECVKACPAQCINLAPDKAGGLPFIIARTSPCVVCEDLSCMKVCPTGALNLVNSPLDIRMGLAAVDHNSCLRNPQVAESAGHSTAGEDCRLCVTSCPLGQDAIRLDAGNHFVQVFPACIGCGVCERACPTEPASIQVRPTNDHQTPSINA